MNATSLIRWSTVLAVTSIAGVAGWVSYEHALAVVRAHGESGAVAMAYPVTVDGVIYSASMVLLDSARRGMESPALARWLLAAGIGATLLANIAAGLRFGVVGAVVAAWPALALVGSYELLMLMIRREAAPAAVTIPTGEAVSETVAAPVPAGVPVSVPETAPVAMPAPRRVNALVDVSGDAVPPVPGRRAPTVASGRAPKRAPRRRQASAERVFAAELEAGELPSLRQIKARAKCGTDRAQAIRDELAGILREAQPAA
jgi:hypothetical protein